MIQYSFEQFLQTSFCMFSKIHMQIIKEIKDGFSQIIQWWTKSDRRCCSWRSLLDFVLQTEASEGERGFVAELLKRPDSLCINLPSEMSLDINLHRDSIERIPVKGVLVEQKVRHRRGLSSGAVLANYTVRSLDMVTCVETFRYFEMNRKP